VNIFGIYDDDAAATRLAIDYSGNVSISGNVGMGTYDSAIPYPKLTVTGPDATVNVETTEVLRVMRHGVPNVKNQNSAGFFVGAFESGPNGRSRLDISVAGTPGPSNTFGSVPDVTVMSLHGDGNVSIGTTNLGARLEVRGGGYGITSRGSDVGLYTQNITVPESKVFLATTAVAGDFYGNVVFRNNISVEGDVILTGADCAEEFDMAEAAEIEPGTVAVFDQDGVLHQSHQAYDKRVAGVVSGAGDYKPGLILDRRQSQDYRVPVALVGKVYCKVDAQYAPIEVGDLLTTSPTLGHAMKAEDPVKAFGSVIGKALRPLEVGQGMIPILIALQ